MAATYSALTARLHWLSAPIMIGCVGSVLKAQQTPMPEKGDWMFRHKSLGLLAGIVVAPRVATRLLQKAPEHLPGAHKLEHIAGSITHMALYSFLLIMPATGIAMGYFGGKGLPFFFTTIPGKAEPDGAVAKQAFGIHKQVGYYGKFLIPLHAGAAVSHAARGHKIFQRINPF
mmetsp:Transcript_21943/g.43581  ORF Transcript_21943/g.43581 Transcript_21943/m.43581 type:complete len:173 (+) Transcript_21943:18-536(+)